eukprot:scaffold168669_cov18-Tisochrysis_lutea.AAC.1
MGPDNAICSAQQNLQVHRLCGTEKTTPPATLMELWKPSTVSAPLTSSSPPPSCSHFHYSQPVNKPESPHNSIQPSNWNCN